MGGLIILAGHLALFYALMKGSVDMNDSSSRQQLIFTEKKIFRVIGVDVEHVQRISAQIDQYIPNFFCDYDPFQLSYEQEKLFADNREEFLRFYESEKRKLA